MGKDKGLHTCNDSSHSDTADNNTNFDSFDRKGIWILMGKEFYYCNHCGNYLIADKEIDHRKIKHFYLDGSDYEFVPICSMCGSDDIEPVENCKVCGEPEKDMDNGVCPYCRDSYFDKINKWVDEETHGDITRDVLLDILTMYVERTY